MQTVASFNYYSREARAPLIVRWIESLVLRFFVPGNIFRLGQFSSCHREVAFSDPFVAPPHFVTRCELGELCAFLSPLAESLRLAQRIWHERMNRRGEVQWGDTGQRTRAYRFETKGTITGKLAVARGSQSAVV
jgi:hypothetical protein